MSHSAKTKLRAITATTGVIATAKLGSLGSAGATAFAVGTDAGKAISAMWASSPLLLRQSACEPYPSLAARARAARQDNQVRLPANISAPAIVPRPGAAKVLVPK